MRLLVGLGWEVSSNGRKWVQCQGINPSEKQRSSEKKWGIHVYQVFRHQIQMNSQVARSELFPYVSCCLPFNGQQWCVRPHPWLYVSAHQGELYEMGPCDDKTMIRRCRISWVFKLYFHNSIFIIAKIYIMYKINTYNCIFRIVQRYT